VVSGIYIVYREQREQTAASHGRASSVAVTKLGPFVKTTNQPNYVNVLHVADNTCQRYPKLMVFPLPTVVQHHPAACTTSW
jgi:hypothetical protein